MLAKRRWTLLFLAIAAFYLWGLGAVPLVGPDEPRYAEVAREMLARGDWITPTLGGLPWFEKPPLLYWLMMASYRVLGVTEYAARLGPAVCGLIAAVFVYWIGRNIDSETFFDSTGDSPDEGQGHLGHWSAMVLLSSGGVIALSRGASFDIVTMMALTGALACFVVWEMRCRTRIGPGSSRGQLGRGVGRDGVSGGRRYLPLIGFFFFVGLSLLAKGLIGIVIPFGVIAGYFLLRREWPDRRFLISLLWGIPIVIFTAGVWYGPMSYRHGWKFIDEFIIQHHFARFTTNKYHHPGPFYYYIPVLLAFALPWTVFLVAAFISGRRWVWRGNTALDMLRVFALAWIAVPVVFFSFSGSKLMPYVLPVMPAVALLVGERITCFLRARGGGKVIRLSGMILIAFAVAGAWYSVTQFGVRPVCVYASALVLVSVGATALLYPRIRKTQVVLIAAAVFVVGVIVIGCMPNAVRSESVRDLLSAAAARGYGATPVVQLHTVERSAEFYAPGRLPYGKDGAPVWFQGAAQVADAAGRNGGQVLSFVPLEHEWQLTTYVQVKTERIGDNGRVALLVVRVR